MIDTMTLDMECFREDLSPVQLAAYEKAEREHNEIRSKLNSVLGNSENIFSGNIFSAYQLSGMVTGLESYSKPVSTIRTQNRKIVQNLTAPPVTSSGRPRPRYVDFDDDDLESMPLAKRKMIVKETPPAKKKTEEKHHTKTQKKAAASPATPAVSHKPNESNAVGGLAIGKGFIGGSPKVMTPGRKDVVDLTKDEGRVPADSREINFNKLQGKTYPSLVVVVRPSLKGKESSAMDRGHLDSKVKNVLMYTPAKFTEWLIQQGLVRSEQTCISHSNQSLKLGMYSDVSKFPYSGGYVWISECCANKFVSVFNGSLFESAGHPPSVLLKLIYHWSCQTNVQNVIQWVKVDNLYVKGFYSWLRSVCTVALYNHFNLLGGPMRKIEVGVISLGTSTMDGQQRQVKVEVLGVYDPVNKFIRLRAVEPLPYSEKSYKKRFLKILEPLVDWVHEDSIILTDLTVDKATLQNYGFKNIIQVNAADQSKNANSNATIMDYLRRIVPRMFQNTLSLLSRPIIQQFLDELVWREWYGMSPGQAFDNIVAHIAEQTRLNAKESLVSRLTKVSTNPFKDWSHLSTKGPISASDIIPPAAPPAKTPQQSKRKRIQSPVPTTPHNTPGPSAKKEKVAPPPKIKTPPAKKAEPAVDLVALEAYYYGVYNPTSVEPRDSAIAVAFEAKCPECDDTFVTNLELQDHIFYHFASHLNNNTTQHQCRYCLEKYVTQDLVTKHIINLHPTETKAGTNAYCDLICEFRYNSLHALAAHMHKHHTSELPFKCGGCSFMCSSRRLTIDHFYNEHGQSAILMCPHCLRIFMAANKQGQVLDENIQAFYDHLKLHTNKTYTKRCNRCSMSFVTKATWKMHCLMDHNSKTHLQSELKPISKANNFITRPKNKPTANLTNSSFKVVLPMEGVRLDVPNGKTCLECGFDFDEENHIVGLVQCQKCTFQTCCVLACIEHNQSCTMPMEQFVVSPLDMEYFCVCGYSSVDGNALARHLVSCERRSAYSSMEIAQENTVQRNMLDMLGLVRRDDDEEDVVDIASNADDLIEPRIETPIEIQSETPTQEINTVEEDVQSEETELTKESEDINQNEELQQSDDIEMMAQDQQETQQTEGSVQEMESNQEEPVQQECSQPEDNQYQEEMQNQDQQATSEDQFNTQLSLDDMGPASVLPPQIQEPDRTPQLREEYQSLATPQVGIQPDYEQSYETM